MFIVRKVKQSFLYTNENISGFESTVLSQLITFIGFLLLIVLFRKFFDRKSFMSLGFSFRPNFRKDLLVGLGLGVGMVGLLFLVFLIAGSISISGIQLPGYDFLLVSILFMIVAFSEEIIWRGYMLDNLLSSFNKYLALFIVSLIFALLHADSPTMTVLGFLNIFLAGIFLGVYYVYKRNLWFPIGLHFGWNLALGPLFGSAVSGNEVPSLLQIKVVGNETLTGGGFGFEGSILTPLLFIVAIIIIHRKFGKASQRGLQAM